MVLTSSCTIGIKLESICHKTTYSQDIGLINFDVLSEREKLLQRLRTQIEEISNILLPQTNLSHQICTVAKKMCRSLQTTQETT